MDYIMDLRSHFKNRYLEYIVFSSICPGNMDMTYLAFLPESLPFSLNH